MALSYESLKTHYYHAISPPRKNVKLLGSAAHSAQAIREYAEIILVCATELEHLTQPPKKK
jgi:hypothetical protein